MRRWRYSKVKEPEEELPQNCDTLHTLVFGDNIVMLKNAGDHIEYKSYSREKKVLFEQYLFRKEYVKIFGIEKIQGEALTYCIFIEHEDGNLLTVCDLTHDAATGCYDFLSKLLLKEKDAPVARKVATVKKRIVGGALARPKDQVSAPVLEHVPPTRSLYPSLTKMAQEGNYDRPPPPRYTTQIEQLIPNINFAQERTVPVHAPVQNNYVPHHNPSHDQQSAPFQPASYSPPLFPLVPTEALFPFVPTAPPMRYEDKVLEHAV